MTLALACQTGCDSNGKPGIKVGGAPELKPEPAEVISSLQAAQANMRRSPAGSIIQVEFRNCAFDRRASQHSFKFGRPANADHLP